MYIITYSECRKSFASFTMSTRCSRDAKTLEEGKQFVLRQDAVKTRWLNECEQIVAAWRARAWTDSTTDEDVLSTRAVLRWYQVELSKAISQKNDHNIKMYQMAIRAYENELFREFMATFRCQKHHRCRNKAEWVDTSTSVGIPTCNITSSR